MSARTATQAMAEIRLAMGDAVEPLLQVTPRARYPVNRLSRNPVVPSSPRSPYHAPVG